MHTVMVISGGLLLLGVFLVVGQLVGGAKGASARFFIPAWFVLAAINMGVGVVHAGYSVAAEAPIFLVVFGVPALVAVLAWRSWRHS